MKKIYSTKVFPTSTFTNQYTYFEGKINSPLLELLIYLEDGTYIIKLKGYSTSYKTISLHSCTATEEAIESIIDYTTAKHLRFIGSPIKEVV